MQFYTILYNSILKKKYFDYSYSSIEMICRTNPKYIKTLAGSRQR